MSASADAAAGGAAPADGDTGKPLTIDETSDLAAAATKAAGGAADDQKRARDAARRGATARSRAPLPRALCAAHFVVTG